MNSTYFIAILTGEVRVYHYFISPFFCCKAVLIGVSYWNMHSNLISPTPDIHILREISGMNNTHIMACVPLSSVSLNNALLQIYEIN